MGTMYLRKITRALSLVVFFCTQGSAFASHEVDLTVSTQVNSSGKVELAFALKNRGPEVITVCDGTLPWQYTDDLLVVVTKTNGDLLSKSLRFHNTIVQGFIKVKPNESISGKIELTGDFPSIDLDRKQRELIVFWTYLYSGDCPLAKSSNQTRFGGWLTIGPDLSPVSKFQDGLPGSPDYPRR